jgi:hypothetical protein
LIIFDFLPHVELSGILVRDEKIAAVARLALKMYEVNHSIVPNLQQKENPEHSSALVAR